VKAIDYSAFAKCENLRTVTLGNNISELFGTFTDCVSLESIIIPESVQIIRTKTFSGCTKLSQITFNEGLLQIDKDAFEGCALTDIVLPNSLKEISALAFKLCDQLKTVTFGSDLSQFDPQSFYQCFALETYLVPNSSHFQAIGGVLYDASGETLIGYPDGKKGIFRVPAGVKVIAKSAFAESIYLTNIELPETLESIEENAFLYCIGIRCITAVGANPPEIDASILHSTSPEIKIFVPNSSLNFYKSIWSPYSSQIIGISDTYTVTFVDNSGTLVNGSKVQLISHGGSAMAPECTLASYALTWDIGFDYVTSDLTVTAVWKPLYVVTFDAKGGTLVSGSAVQNIMSGRGAVAPVFEFENYIFVGWEGSFDEIYGDTTIYAVWETAIFTYNLGPDITITGLKPDFVGSRLVIPEFLMGYKVSAIRYNAFKDKTFLIEVTIPASIETIGSGIFSGCTSLTTLTIPLKEAYLSNTNSFLLYYFGATTPWCGIYAPSSLKTVNVQGGIATLSGNAFMNCFDIENITIPLSVTKIDGSAFYKCYNLKSFVVHDGITIIGNGAFTDCTSLTEIFLPNSVTSLQLYAFSGCSGLKDLYVLSAIPPTLGSNSLVSTNAAMKIHVLASSYDSFVSATNWANYSAQIYGDAVN
jgi:hypothetical protein